MQVTNKHNLFKPLYLALAEDNYSSGGADYSVSELINPPLLTYLYRKHKDEIQVDAINNLWKVFGTIGHILLTKHAKGDIEKRLFLEADGIKISGQPDIVNNDEVIDGKITSVFKVKKKDFTDWTAQLNLYDYLLHKNGTEVKSLRLIAILRDWSAGYAGREKGYPELPIFDTCLERWSRQAQETYLAGRLALHTQHNDKPEPCTSLETWGGKRCERYCEVSEFCKGRRAIKK